MSGCSEISIDFFYRLIIFRVPEAVFRVSAPILAAYGRFSMQIAFENPILNVLAQSNPPPVVLQQTAPPV